jgi:outer membrane putative beta-barrel porin/alpha-amylase
MRARRTVVLAVASGLWVVHPALAQDRDFCAERPGQTTPPCTLAPGEVMIESAAAAWTVTRDSGVRSDQVTIAGSLLRIGLTPRLEVQAGWTPFGIQHVKDRLTGRTTSRTGAGDVSLELIYGLAGANGPVAIQPFVTLPTGGSAIGAGDWGAGVRLPVALPLNSKLQLALTPELDAAVNSSGNGRHLAYGGAAGIGLPLSSKVSLGADVAVFRDEDPDGAATHETGGLSLAWQESADTQFDVGGTVGLNHASPDLGLYVGIAHRFR